MQRERLVYVCAHVLVCFQMSVRSYCIRKTTLRAYIDTLRMEDQLFGHPYFLKAAAGAIRTYLAITDAPSAAQKVRHATWLLVWTAEHTHTHRAHARG